MRKWLLVFLLICTGSFAYDMKSYDLEIVHILQEKKVLSSQSLSQRIEEISQDFVGRSYLDNALGEGPQGVFDQDPLYRTDAFDCMTYVSTVLALAHAHNLNEFQQNILQLNYHSAEADFFQRDHFVSIDWNIQNQQKHYLQDITKEISSAILIAHANIDKPNWYRHLTAKNLKQTKKISNQKTENLMKQLHAHSTKEVTVESYLEYIPLENIVSKNNQLNLQILNKIPSGAILEIVEANKDFTRKIGTHLNVAHMGFAIRTSQGLMFREASSAHQRVVDVPLQDYLLALSHHYDAHMTGINVELPV